MAAIWAKPDHLSRKFLKAVVFELLGSSSKNQGLVKIDLEIKGL
jgi:hypothetical protein